MLLAVFKSRVHVHNLHTGPLLHPGVFWPLERSFKNLHPDVNNANEGKMFYFYTV